MADDQVAIIGAGGMGTALAVLVARTGTRVRLWARDPQQASRLTADRVNQRHLPGVPLPGLVQVTSDPAQALEAATLAIAAVPTSFLRATLAQVARFLPGGTAVVSVVKGIERGTGKRPTQVIGETLGHRGLAVLSGPSHAEEFARGLPASVVLAGPDVDLCVRVRSLLMGEAFRVYLNRDIVGVELAGALKNILGLAAGICDGLGFGDNAKAALLTRGLVEMSRFAAQWGAQPETFWGLAGVGDVLTTCYSPFGRNRSVGIKLAEGQTLPEIQAGMADVAEGVTTTQSVVEWARPRGVSMPITEEVHAILFDHKSPRAAVTDLMLRDPKFE